MKFDVEHALMLAVVAVVAYKLGQRKPMPVQNIATSAPDPVQWWDQIGSVWSNG